LEAVLRVLSAAPDLTICIREVDVDVGAEAEAEKKEGGDRILGESMLIESSRMYSSPSIHPYDLSVFFDGERNRDIEREEDRRTTKSLILKLRSTPVHTEERKKSTPRVLESKTPEEMTVMVIDDGTNTPQPGFFVNESPTVPIVCMNLSIFLSTQWTHPLENPPKSPDSIILNSQSSSSSSIASGLTATGGAVAAPDFAALGGAVLVAATKPWGALACLSRSAIASSWP
jgi:hypothetical protein